MKKLFVVSLFVTGFCLHVYSQESFFRRDSNFGTGFNTATGVEKGQALTFTSLRNETRFAGSGQSLTFNTVQINSRDSLFHELNTTVSAKGKGSYGAFKASGSVNYSSFRSLSINNYSKYLLVKMFVANPDEILRSLRLTKEARELAESRPDDFLREYGDEFVTRKTMGGQINVLYEFRSHSSSERNKTDLAIKALASYFGASGSGGMTRTQVEDKLKEVSELRVWLLRDGGITTIPALTLEELDKYVRENFLPDVRLHPRVIGVHTRKFSDAFSSATAGVSFNKIRKQKEFLDEAFLKINEITQSLENARYVLDHPDEFDPEEVRKGVGDFDKKHLEHLKHFMKNLSSNEELAEGSGADFVSDRIRAYIEAGREVLLGLDEKIEACERDFDQCSGSPGLDFPDFVIPVRSGPSRLKHVQVVEVNMNGAHGGGHYDPNSPMITDLGKCDWNEIKFISLRGRTVYESPAMPPWRGGLNFSVSFTDISDGTPVMTVGLDAATAVPWPPGTSAKVSLTYSPGGTGYPWGPRVDGLRTNTYKVYIH